MGKLTYLFWSAFALVIISFGGSLYQGVQDAREKEIRRSQPVEAEGPAVPAE